MDDESVVDPAPDEVPGEELTGEPATVDPNAALTDDPQLFLPIEWRPYTPFSTGGDGIINVIHEITLGELLLSTLIMALLVFVVISRIVRR